MLVSQVPCGCWRAKYPPENTGIDIQKVQWKSITILAKLVHLLIKSFPRGSCLTAQIINTVKQFHILHIALAKIKKKSNKQTNNF